MGSDIPPIQTALKLYAEQEETAFGGPPTSEQLKAAEDFFATLLKDSVKYHSYAVENGKTSRLVCAWKLQDDMGRDALVVYPFILDPGFATLETVQAELQKLRSYSGPEPRRILTRLFASQIDVMGLLQDQGFKPEAFELVGKISDALNHFKKDHRAIPPSMRMSPMNFDTEIEEVLDLIQAAHGSDPSSRGEMHSPRSRENMKAHLKGMHDDGMVFLLRDGSRLVAEIGLKLQPARKDCALLGSISVDPAFQGQGLSNLLYLTGLEAAEARGAKYFVGNTTTKRVLANREKLGRKVRSVTLYLA